MVDKTYNLLIPTTKAVDNGDGTHSLAVAVEAIVGVGTDTTFRNILPPLKAVDNGDGTYSVAVVLL